MSKPAVHCWECGPLDADGMSRTCMLLRGHDGPHEWTRDNAIVITFAAATGGSHAE